MLGQPTTLHEKREILSGIFEHRSILFVNPDFCAEFFFDRADSTDMIKMPVGKQNLINFGMVIVNKPDNIISIVCRINHDSLFSLIIDNDITVGL